MERLFYMVASKKRAIFFLLSGELGPADSSAINRTDNGVISWFLVIGAQFSTLGTGGESKSRK